MSYQNDFLATRPRKQHCLLDSSSLRRAGSSTRTRHPRICSSTSLLPNGSSSRDDLDNVNLLDSLDDITLDGDLDRRSASSATLLSQLSESRQSCSLYPLHEPGQMTAQRTQRLRARIASVIMSIPATCEDVVDVDENQPRKAVEEPPVAQVSKLRRVSGLKDLRRAFRDADHVPSHFPSISSLGLSKASHELGILATPTPLLSNLSPRSSLRTLVDLANALPQSSADLKTLCESTLSSVSTASQFATKVHSTLPLRSSHTCLSPDTSQPIFPGKYPIHNSSIPRPHRHTSLQQDTRPPQSPREAVWSCAKISRSAVKRAARRGHPPRRVFSSPITVLSS
ncbi:hypothetical protein J3R82DRAFT_5478 [Butyriboletus roseoflavus]|nr:hypothetical protein J3R82DRAFT_5478 [Butyriboletus roseoflavus]